MAKFEIRKQAFILRKQGMSLGVIAKVLKVSKSTVSKWCIDISLTSKQKKLLKLRSTSGGQIGRLMGAKINREKKLNNIRHYEETAQRQIAQCSERDLLIGGIALYWAEGAKTEGTSGFSFMNADPQMIIFIIKFLTSILKVKKEDIVCTIQINRVHEARVNKVLKFWSTLLELPLTQFKKPYYVNVVPHKVYENHDSYYGTLRVKVKKSSNLKYHLLGLVKAFKMSA